MISGLEYPDLRAASASNFCDESKCVSISSSEYPALRAAPRSNCGMGLFFLEGRGGGASSGFCGGRSRFRSGLLCSDRVGQFLAAEAVFREERVLDLRERLPEIRTVVPKT